MTGVASMEQYVAALHSITFSTTSTNIATRSISVVALDGALQSLAEPEQVDVTAPPPVVTPSGSTGNYAVGNAATAVDPGVTVASFDGVVTGATVTISAGTLDPGDTLNFTNQNGISGSYSGGVLTLSGSATAAQYQAALQSVAFSSTTTNTSITTRAISIVAIDNTLIGDPAQESLNVGRDFVTPSGLTINYTSGAPGACSLGNNRIFQQQPSDRRNGDDLPWHAPVGRYAQLHQPRRQRHRRRLLGRRAHPERQRHGGPIPGGLAVA